MKKLLAILVCFALVGICSSATAATVLSDKELGELYAGISGIPFINHPVTEQTNIATVTAIGIGRDGDIFGTGISQSNKASVRSLVMAKLDATAIGPQKNIAALYASDGDIIGTAISQKNNAKVSGAVIATGVPIKIFGRTIGTIPGTATAIDKQLNVAALVAGEKGCGKDGDIAFTSIRQSNKARVCGMVMDTDNATAIKSQTNIAALLAGDDIKFTSISQKNKAKVKGCVIAPCKVTKIGPQLNVAALVAKGDIIGTCVRQSNSARVSGSGMVGVIR
jgi:hypothetical protein